MSSGLDLSALTKSSARVAAFPVKICSGRVSQYTYTQNKYNIMVTAHKFEAWLVGTMAESYCIGFVKGTAPVVHNAARDYPDGSVRILTKPAFDTFAAAHFISTPVPFRIDLAKSTLLQKTEGAEEMPCMPVPPRTVAEVARITTNKSTDLIAVLKQVCRERSSKTGHDIADVQLLDDSEIKPDHLAIVTVSVFGRDKIKLLKDNIGKPMVFFNLSVSCSAGQTTINHYAEELVTSAPDCSKTESLTEKATELAAAENTISLTSTWTSHEVKDVSGPQPLSCAAFLDYTAEVPESTMPSIVQLMWVHLEEPDADSVVLDSSGTRIWYRVQTRDCSGSTTIGIPERNALLLASCTTVAEFRAKHAQSGLNIPLLCHVRISRSVREQTAGASQPGSTRSKFVNHTLESVEPVLWDPTSAPNAAYNGVINLLNNCPPHDEGLLFAFLADISPDPHYGFCVAYDKQDGPRCTYVVSLVASESKSTTESIGTGFKVITTAVKDYASPAGASEPGYTLMGFCTLVSLTGFRLDPPRGEAMRCAISLFVKRDDQGFHIHTMEYIEPDQVDTAVQCMLKLRLLCKSIRPTGTDKRSHSVSVCTTEASGVSKKARTLHVMPTDASLPDDAP